MKKLTVYFTLSWLFLHNSNALAMSTKSYNMLQDAIYSFFAIGCFFVASFIFLSLRGGSLGKPWLLIMLGFILAAGAGTVQLLDVFQVIVHEYDLRLATLLMSGGSMFFLFFGLFLYKKALD